MLIGYPPGEPMKKQIPRIPKLIRPYAVSGSKGFRLKHFDPGDTQGFDLKPDADVHLDMNIQRLSEMQERLYAQDCWSILLVFQAMDARMVKIFMRRVDRTSAAHRGVPDI